VLLNAYHFIYVCVVYLTICLYLGYVKLNGRITDECSIGEDLEETIVALSRYYPEICVQELRKTAKDLSQDSRYLVREYNRASPEHKPTVLQLQQPAQYFTYVNLDVRNKFN
jgi:hypothetical protein